MSAQPFSIARAPDAATQARVHLAAAHRLAVMHELDEGIDNHFTMNLPNRDGQYLILPFGRHWSEARASELIVFDESVQPCRGKARSNCRRNAYTRRSIGSAAPRSCCIPTRHGRSR